MYVIFTDTDCDISSAKAKELGYQLISMPYSIDGKTVYPYEDFDEFNVHEFYDMLRRGTLPNTSAVSSEKYIQYFEPFFAAGQDILYVHFSAAMTMTFDVMKTAVDELLKKYPERKFYQVDTKGITTISYVIACEIADLYHAGKTPEEILSWAEKEVDCFAMYFFVDDLKFFKHSGRVSGLAATMGTMLGVRPIIYMSPEGKMVSIGRERGRTRAMEHLVNRVAELGKDIEKYRICIGHTDAEPIANEMAAMLKARFGESLNIEIVPVNPTAGSHCGPEGVGVCFHAIHR